MLKRRSDLKSRLSIMGSASTNIIADSSRTLQRDQGVGTDWFKSKEDEDEDDINEEHSIPWINIIFLPFQHWWQVIIIFTVCVKCFLGPLTSIFPIMFCSKEIDEHPSFQYLKIYYVYIGDPVYVIDTFLYIVHRQVVDEAMKREHLPKPAGLLMLDMLSLVPFYGLFGGEQCSPITFWPNILYFHEIFIVYRVGHYFSLNISHSVRSLITGYVIMLILFINGITCFFLLLTYNGLCSKCDKGLYDWRVFTYANLEIHSGGHVGIYLYAANFLMSIVTHYLIDETEPNTLSEYLIVNILMQVGYILTIFVIMPKLFAEITIRFSSIHKFQPRARRIIGEIKRRNASLETQRRIEKFYTVMWVKQNGITRMPSALNQLPIEITLEIKLDLVWTVFYHSPTFRHTTMAFKRYLCQFVDLTYKLPGERFFTGQNCYTNLYYIKSGIVNLISIDESSAPLLSMTSGTVLGDVSFYVPPKERKLFVRCSSYCEVFSISRFCILQSLHKFPQDRKLILRLVNERLRHAHDLHILKHDIRGRDRCEDEEIQWFKRRWWEISNAISGWKSLSKKSRKQKCRIPPEEDNYHCCKFIGQLVLSKDIHLQRKSLFIKVTFPWLLLPNSAFNQVWNWIIKITVILVLIIFPPLITKTRFEGTPVQWFKYFDYIVSTMYVIDVIVTLLTAVEGTEQVTSVLTSIINHSRDKKFILDLLSTPWIDVVLVALNFHKYALLTRYNRLIKTYLLFSARSKPHWNDDHLSQVYIQLAVLCFSCLYVPAYFVYLLTVEMPEFTTSYFFGDMCLHDDKSLCNSSSSRHLLTGLAAVPFTWLGNLMYSSSIAQSFWDILLGGFVCLFYIFLFIYVKISHICALYAIFEDIISYQFIVTNAKQYFKIMKIHPDLLTRLERYLDVHWRHHKGMDILHPNLMSNEPYDIYWNIHGEVAERLISQSKAFKNASHSLILELAKKAEFLMIPKNGIIFAFGVQIETVTWIVNGSVKCEYQGEDGETLHIILDKHEVMAMTTVFFGETALRTYSAITDCEVLCLNLRDFASTVQRYPDEWRIFETCIEELRPEFKKLYKYYVVKNKQYKQKLRTRIFHDRKSVISLHDKNKKGTLSPPQYFLGPIKSAWLNFRSNPESVFIRYWLGLRAITVFVYATAGALQGGSGAVIFNPLQALKNLCIVFTILDMGIKMFIPYYGHDGLIITDYHKCARYYMTRGFVADVIGLIISFPGVASLLLSEEVERAQRLLNSFADCIHLYLLTGFFDYYANKPSANTVYIMILKWQVVSVVLILHLSYYYVWDCIIVEFDNTGSIIRKTRANETCWMPMQFKLDAIPTIHQLHIVFAQSINLIQSNLLNTFVAYFEFSFDKIKQVAIFAPFNVYYWYQTCYCEILLILHLQGHSRVHHGTNQLVNFLKEERVEKETIDRAIDYFSYWWKRTLGIDLKLIMSRKFSVVFREDLYYYFYRTTLKATGTLLRGGEAINRQIASVCLQMHLLPNEDIVREMQLSSDVYVVHRGEVVISKHGKTLAIITKGSIFGQLEGMNRPIHITATTVGYVDVLKISNEEFQQIINDEVRSNITDHYESQLDFIPLEEPIVENPYNTIEYILRPKKIIRLPRMVKPVSAHDNKYYRRWLFCSWVAEPILASALVLIIITLPAEVKAQYTAFTVALDLLHVIYLATELYTMQVVIENLECVFKYIGWRKLTEWWLYIDVASVIIPLFTIITSYWEFQLARLFRIYSVYFYHRMFFRDYRARTKAMLLKFVLILLLLHSLACVWLTIACRSHKHITELPVNIYELPPSVLNSVDSGEWVETYLRRDGCPRRTKFYDIPHLNITTKGFLVPRDWKHDYLIAMTYIFILQTHLNMDSIMPLSLGEIQFKIFAQYVLYLLELWMVSLAISSIYTRYREMYEYDFRVYSLTKYLKQNGICSFLTQAVRTYTKLLWRKYKGSQLPEITYQAPLCLRQDIFTSLYMYHLKTPAVFNWLPDYFLKQLVVKVKRIVIFPGKCILRAGDINPHMYFIHEGEVERWYIDRKGENRLSTLLTSGGYFGIVSGLYPNIPVQFTYYTRTIVDLIYLHFNDWQELLESYSEIRQRLYSEANRVKLGATVDKSIQSVTSSMSLK